MALVEHFMGIGDNHRVFNFTSTGDYVIEIGEGTDTANTKYMGLSHGTATIIQMSSDAVFGIKGRNGQDYDDIIPVTVLDQDFGGGNVDAAVWKSTKGMTYRSITLNITTAATINILVKG